MLLVFLEYLFSMVGFRYTGDILEKQVMLVVLIKTAYFRKFRAVRR